MSSSVRVLLLAVFVLPVAACGQSPAIEVDGVQFVRQTVSVPPGQKEAVTGDLTGDGLPDLLLAVENSVLVFRGDGSGGFGHRQRFDAGPNPVGPVVAELNGDGPLDVVVANHETTQLTLLGGTGSGALEPLPTSPLSIDVAPHPHAVRAADLDGDGYVDLVVDHREAGGVLVLRGRGDGTFLSPGMVVDAGGDPYRGMAVGDLNDDGHPDLVTPNPSAVGILLNDGTDPLRFSQHAIDTQAGPFAVGLGDLNADGHLDVVAALDEGSSLVRVYLGDGAGTFQEASTSPFRLTAGGKSIAQGDFNGDGVDDAAITCWNGSEVLLLLGGTDALRTATLPVEGNPWGPTGADWNGDGVDDLIIPDAGSGRVVAYLSRVK